MKEEEKGAQETPPKTLTGDGKHVATPSERVGDAVCLKSFAILYPPREEFPNKPPCKTHGIKKFASSIRSGVGDFDEDGRNVRL